jgi:RNA polymerase sigma-70 factor (ECF subfamily)
MVGGDRLAFDEFAETYIPILYRFAAFRLRNDPELTREIAQATLVKAIEKIGSFRGEASLTTWLCACCKSEIAAHFRRSRSRPAQVELTEEWIPDAVPQYLSPPEGPERAALRGETRERVHAALDLLPPRHARVLEWKYLDNLPVKEIAARIALSAKAAESLLTRARDSFREVYARLQMEQSHERK